MNKSGNDLPDKMVVSFLCELPPGERTKYWSHSLHQRAKFLVVPWIKNLLDSRNFTVYLHPVLKFSGESILMSVNELWFGLHFACLLNKALNFERLPMESGSQVKGVTP